MRKKQDSDWGKGWRLFAARGSCPNRVQLRGAGKGNLTLSNPSKRGAERGCGTSLSVGGGNCVVSREGGKGRILHIRLETIQVATVNFWG